MMNNSSILELKKVTFAYLKRVSILGKTKPVYVLDKINLNIHENEIIALVGESGCGKTTLGKIIAGLYRPWKGEILYQGKNVWKMSKQEFKEYRRHVQMVHQNPFESLNPSHTVFDIISFPLFRHKIVKNREEAEQKIRELLEIVGLSPPEIFMSKYPHELSGGQRQRVVIARTLSVEPKVLIADEPVSMLDVSLRLDLLNLMLNLQKEFGMAIIFITHDFGLARYFAKNGRTVVMYLGQIIEIGNTEDVILNPYHPYTKALLSVVPVPDPNYAKTRKVIELRSWDIPSIENPPTGCRFHPRCPYYIEGKCNKQEPELRKIDKNRLVACHIFS